MARDTAEVIEQLMAQESFIFLLYELQLKDEGYGVAGSGTMTDSTKSWLTDEWATNTTILTDKNGDRFIVTGNTDTQLTVTGTPASGEFTVERWFYLSSHMEAIDSEGKPSAITFGEDEFTRAKVYIPYPVDHKVLYDHELGKFPRVTVTIYNPGTEAFSTYYNLLESFDFYSLFERYKALRGNTLNIIIGFIDSDGEIITSPDTTNIINGFVIQNSDISRDSITFTLSSLGNFPDKQIPARSFSKVTCGWVYKGDKCFYKGSDPTLTTPITRCNKLLRSYAYGDISKGGLYLTNPGYGNTFTLPSSFEMNAAMEDYLLGCIVETSKAPYLWRVTAVNGSVLTIRSNNNLKPLSNYVDTETETIKVNIYEKECCFGHSDTGALVVHPPAYSEKMERGFCKYNDLVFNGDFNNLVGVDSLSRWALVGNISLQYGYAFIIGGSELSTQLYDYTDPNDTIPLETGKRFNLVFRYYGASTLSGQTRNFSYRLRANMSGSTYYWNAETEAFQGGIVTNDIALRPYNQRLNIANFDDEKKKEVRYFRFDEYVSSVVLSYGGATRVYSINLDIYTNAGSEVVFNYVSFIMHNQFERFGGFPAIPTSRFWYF